MVFTSALAPFRRLFNEWAEKRRPKGQSVLLNQKRIFILPTLAGWGFLLLCITIFLVGVNYQNNLIYALVFFLIALGVLTIHYTFLNLSGLRVSAYQTNGCHVGEVAEFCLRIERSNRRHYEGVSLSLAGSVTETVSLVEDDHIDVKLFVVAPTRGYFNPGAVHIATVYPFGLFKAWSWLQIDQKALIFPKVLKGPSPQLSGQGDKGAAHREQGDDFSGLEEYRPGMPTRHIAWKQFAQGRGVLSKKYSGQKSNNTWLCWNDWPDLSTERRLSVLCYWALRLNRQGENYGLDMPGLNLVPTTGQAHLHKVLSALACYGQEGEE